ncbi:MAG: hypothetical protein UV58_C0013G0018 [Candidatus Wolfebacteria bacterium GW2011_GWC1_43_10]|uniref:Uncharacterized protein n=1 Tax=Candidatus Wolfebacteria bacterium GW2011_GWC1_43_10 TaxID=1619011 RepID=A0A0G1C8T7_9BACT|nr:MAG: hypothetical protein UV58_C0013G0018 [Candidatus Wolfebacteria bacterium GW2011_GWC1_43_10]HZX13028.1 hypothetical protein [Thermodesulfobacteriota bacterium]
MLLEDEKKFIRGMSRDEFIRALRYRAFKFDKRYETMPKSVEEIRMDMYRRGIKNTKNPRMRVFV